MDLSALANLHLLRPWWLCALLALPWLVWRWQVHRRRQNAWRDIVDPHLLQRLLQPGADRRSRFVLWLAALAYVLAIVALAGPSWRQSAQPLWQNRTPLVIALDLSSAIMAGDLPPSRLAQARAKLGALLRERRGGPVGLVVFAGDAFTVAPLTQDAANVALFLDALQPDVMPVDGQRADRAIEWSVRLLERAGPTRGVILMLTDRADAASMNAAAKAANAGHRVSVLGLGKRAGASYRLRDGQIASARLDPASLRTLAARGNGRYAELTADDSDLRALDVLDPGPHGQPAAAGGEAGRAWQDEGYWLLPPLLLLALIAFRRRSSALAIVLLGAAMPWPPARAADLWRRPDQAEHAQLQRGNAAYRAAKFAQAAAHYRELDSATAHYNRGNALAKSGQYPQAIAAYDEALRLQPGMEDALANRRAVQAAMKRKPPPGSKQGQQQSSRGQQQQAGTQQGQGQSQGPAGTQPQPVRPAAAQPPQPADPNAQADANQAQRERMQRALEQARNASGPEGEREPPRRSETAEQRERRLANEAWLRRVPDDPGGLLRAKFLLEHERRAAQETQQR